MGLEGQDNLTEKASTDKLTESVESTNYCCNRRS
jgi:hypothetical protein